ncbi:CST, telomere maintenance, complex subunit CTC1-domain-containing protein [Radiomyces spectabilis]|uniref:CST, telomere maintenance, complex subunit CTC1-domain-containing protein n=1 Tax=Radiomyces spectabilis TaxID=64574 RepID=UPI00221E7CB7|nr:CST, telomere maintenance, complex subunit CTC1-domain-containing protein [Radiomyces spectabilis]KAI8372940.1 CST, telomere maintenance, complex subunit CTC1-domain-containing protein [Radiomyces spectabilis]
MDTISVKSLLERRKSCTSTTAQVELMGILRVISGDLADHLPRGVIVMSDLNTDDTILCQVDRFHHSLDGSALCLRRWNFIYSDDNGVVMLEFQLSDAYRVTSATPVVGELIRADEVAVQFIRIQQLTVHTPHQLQHCRLHSHVHVMGRIFAQSVIYTSAGQPAVFFIEMSDDSLFSCMIVFEGDDLLKYYYDFQIGTLCCFMNLTAVTVSGRQPTERGAFRFKSMRSTYHRITQSHYDMLYSDLAASSQIASTETSHYSPVIQRSVMSTTIPLFKGTVTRVIDHLFGMYELDHQWILCLFHHIGYSSMRPYRPQTKLRIHHAHMVALESDIGQSVLLNETWRLPPYVNNGKPYRLALVTCMRSHIEIEQFPDHCDWVNEHSLLPAIEYVNKGDDGNLELTAGVYVHCLEQRFNFSQMMRQLEVYAALIYKFRQQFEQAEVSLLLKTGNDLAHQVFKRTGTRTAGLFGSLLGDFLQHGYTCPAVATSASTHETHRISLDGYPTMAQLVNLQLAKAPSRDTFSSSAATTKTMTVPFLESHYSLGDKSKHQHYGILGVITSLADGRLYVSDNSHAWPLVVQLEKGDDGPIVGDLYLLQQYRMICEDLSYVAEEGDKILLDHTYIICSSKHLTHVAALRPNVPLFFLETIELTDQLSHFTAVTLSNTMEDLWLFLATGMYATETQSDDRGMVYLEKRVQAMRYGVTERCDPAEVTLVFRSRSGSLQYVSNLQVGSWFVLSGLANTDTFRIEPSTYRKAKQALETQPSIYFIDANHHTFYQVIHRRESYTIPLIPQYRADTTNNPLRHSSVIYDVNDLLAANKPEVSNGPKISLIEVKGGLYEELANIQGVIVNKEFREGRTVDEVVDQHAVALFRSIGVGTGKPGRILFLRLRQTDGLNMFDIYMDVSTRTYPSGLLPGATVIFRNLLRKKANNIIGCYCIANNLTTVTLGAPSDRAKGVIATDLLERRHLCSFIESEEEKSADEAIIYKVTSSVKSILTLTLCWQCLDCGNTISRNTCYGECRNARRVFVADAIVLVTDGTADGLAFIDGEKLVLKLLMLTEQQMDDLKTAILQHGMAHFGAWTNNSGGVDSWEEILPGITLASLGAHVQNNGRYQLFVRRIEKKSTFRADDDDDCFSKLRLRKMQWREAGQPIDTLIHDRIRVKVIDMDVTEPSIDAWTLVDQLQAFIR